MVGNGAGEGFVLSPKKIFAPSVVVCCEAVIIGTDNFFFGEGQHLVESAQFSTHNLGLDVVRQDVQTHLLQVDVGNPYGINGHLALPFTNVHSKVFQRWAFGECVERSDSMNLTLGGTT